MLCRPSVSHRCWKHGSTLCIRRLRRPSFSALRGGRGFSPLFPDFFPVTEDSISSSSVKIVLAKALRASAFDPGPKNFAFSRSSCSEKPQSSWTALRVVLSVSLAELCAPITNAGGSADAFLMSSTVFSSLRTFRWR